MAMMIEIGMLLFPRLTQLDMTGPFEVLHRVPDARMHLVWKDTKPVRAESGLAMLPTTTLDDCPPLDVIVVPGGYGQADLMADDAVLGFLRKHGERANYVTSVCTGALLLGAAGLLAGYKATTHWAYVEMLPAFGATYAPGRVVVDRNRMTGGGVTAGIDFGLRLAAALAGDQVARGIELGLEYNPEPPFRCGHPDLADAALVAEVRKRIEARRSARSD
jgi:cyclohexyl-isocyanide hydratase